MVTPFPPTVNHEGWPARARECAANGGFKIEDVDFVIFTPVNVEQYQTGDGKPWSPIERAQWVMDKWGYTGSACLPIAFDDAVNWAR